MFVHYKKGSKELSERIIDVIIPSGDGYIDAFCYEQNDKCNKNKIV